MTADDSDVVGRLVSRLADGRIAFCVIGGLAVNAYVEPVVSLDLDVVVAAGDLDRLLPALETEFHLERFAHSVNLSAPGSDVRVQLQLDPRYAAFVPRAERRMVLGIEMPVARVEDVMRRKIWAASDTTRRPSKRQKDLADIARMLESYPELRSGIPAEILDRLV